MQALDLVGHKFHRLTVVAEAPKRTQHRLWLCRCECGVEREASTGDLRSGNTKSCGCLLKDTCRATGQLSVVRLAPGEAGFRQLLRKYKAASQERGHEFRLSEEEFRQLTKQNCHYCNREPAQTQFGAGYKPGSKERAAYVYNGVDRKDPAIGYEPENCVPACADCNLAKQSLTYDTFLALIQRIHSNHFKD